MLYAQTASANKAADLQSDLARLAETRGQRSPAANAALDIFTAHVHALLREQLEMDSLLNDIGAVPIAAHLDEIYALLGNTQWQVELQSHRYRRALFIFAAALAALLMYVAIKLIRSRLASAASESTVTKIWWKFQATD